MGRNRTESQSHKTTGKYQVTGRLNLADRKENGVSTMQRCARTTVNTAASITQPHDLPGFYWDAERERYFPDTTRRAEVSNITQSNSFQSNNTQQNDTALNAGMSTTQRVRTSVPCSSVCSMLLTRELRGSHAITVAIAQAVVSSRALHSISTPTSLVDESLRNGDTAPDRGCAEGLLKRLMIKHPLSRIMYPTYR